MNPRVQIAKCRMNRAVARHPGHCSQTVGPQQDAEMAFAGAIIASMASMHMTFIHDFNLLRRECRNQPLFHFGLHGHF